MRDPPWEGRGPEPPFSSMRWGLEAPRVWGVTD